MPPPTTTMRAWRGKVMATSLPRGIVLQAGAPMRQLTTTVARQAAQVGRAYRLLQGWMQHHRGGVTQPLEKLHELHRWIRHSGSGRQQGSLSRGGAEGGRSLQALR